MLEKLGVVSNTWEKRLAAGDRFEDLTVEFCRNGFKHIEIRDGDYLRSTEMGRFFEKIESAMDRFSDAQWKTLCDNRNQPGAFDHRFDARDMDLFHSIASFAKETAEAKFSYAMSHPWESRVDSIDADNRIITRALKLACLICPGSPRLRLVDTRFKGPVDQETAVSNLNRYRGLADHYCVEFCIENALLPATATLELARKGKARFVYDEANTYATDGTTLNPPGDFWNALDVGLLTSVHIKQKTAAGVSSVIGDGYVDFRKILGRLEKANYPGDLLIENAPSENPLEDAIRSRQTLLAASS